METKLIKEINHVLKAFPEFWQQDSGEPKLLRAKVIDAINSKQPKLNIVIKLASPAVVNI